MRGDGTGARRTEAGATKLWIQEVWTQGERLYVVANRRAAPHEFDVRQLIRDKPEWSLEESVWSRVIPANSYRSLRIREPDGEPGVLRLESDRTFRGEVVQEPTSPFSGGGKITMHAGFGSGRVHWQPVWLEMPTLKIAHLDTIHVAVYAAEGIGKFSLRRGAALSVYGKPTEPSDVAVLEVLEATSATALCEEEEGAYRFDITGNAAPLVFHRIDVTLRIPRTEDCMVELQGLIQARRQNRIVYSLDFRRGLPTSDCDLLARTNR